MKRIFLLLGVVLLANSACSPVLPYAAQVNGDTISVTTLNDELHAVLSNPRYSALLDQSFSAGGGASGLHPGGPNTVNSEYVSSQLLFNRVLVTLIDQAVQAEHVVITDEQRKASEVLVRGGMRPQGATDDSLFNSLPSNYQAYLINRQAALSALIQSRERAYYDQHQSEFANYCISHILVTTEAQAQDLKNQIAGGADFAALAKANSQDTGSAPEGGSLGCVSGAQLASFVKPFADAIPTLVVGQVSGVVQTSFGFHLILLSSKEQQSFADSKQQIDSTLNNKFFTDALAAAKIKVNPRYGTFEPGNSETNTQAQIVPPRAAALAPATTTTTLDPNSLSGMDPSTGGAQPIPDTPSSDQPVQ